MLKLFRCLWILYICLFFTVYNTSLSLAEPIPEKSSSLDPSLEETKKLLQKGLTIYEIDQEVARLSEKEASFTINIDEAMRNIKQQDILVQHARSRAAEVLRAYYTGERESFWLLVFSAHSFSDALFILDYLHMIVMHDHKTISEYVKTYRELKSLHAGLVILRSEVKVVKDQFLNQRKRLFSLQQELDAQLKQHPEGQELERQINALVEEWESRGLPFFKKYFTALAAAMNQLPEIITSHKDTLTMDGYKYTFQITDEQLRDFLRSKNPIFVNFSLAFNQDQLVAHGKEQAIDLKIAGHYELEEEPENALRFHIDELEFNGFTLPDTTRSSLQEQYELAFYPKNLASFLLATGVEMLPGKLKVQLKLNLDS